MYHSFKSEEARTKKDLVEKTYIEGGDPEKENKIKERKTKKKEKSDLVDKEIAVNKEIELKRISVIKEKIEVIKTKMDKNKGYNDKVSKKIKNLNSIASKEEYSKKPSYPDYLKKYKKEKDKDKKAKMKKDFYKLDLKIVDEIRDRRDKKLKPLLDFKNKVLRERRSLVIKADLLEKEINSKQTEQKEQAEKAQEQKGRKPYKPRKNKNKININTDDD